MNPGRMMVAQGRATAAGAKAPPMYAPADFKKMIAETKPQYVIVTTVDATHDEYIVAAMEAGCDVISEKPMTTTPEKAQRILDTQKRTGRSLRVTFNYRYSPPRTQVKDILMSGEIGDIYSVDFHWLLNTTHGADYFRRWHSNKANSGGLVIHKASHHFDLVNWWLGDVPQTVYANGKREFYTPVMARRMGLDSHHERCTTCPEKDKCGFYLDLSASADMRRLYVEQEKHDGYFRDKCVFRPDIDIEDTLNLIVKYSQGATLSYSVNAFNAWEGYMVAFNGTKGRLEHTIVEQSYMNGDGGVQGGIAADGVTTRVMPLRTAGRIVEPWTGEGGHGGGDKVMLDEIFLPTHEVDKYKRASDQRGGAYAVLIGMAANISMARGEQVTVADLVTGLTAPDMAPMPMRGQPLPMPQRPARRA
jgi:predicted dehydrogenase